MSVSCPSLSAELLESELFGHAKGSFTGAIKDFPGRISLGQEGTLFLDEIGDLPLAIQPKLLRFIQEKKYERIGENVTRNADVRLIAASNLDLEKAVNEGRFREDLYYRLNVVEIEIPPLRERKEDIEAIAGTMLLFFGRSNHRAFKGFTAEALAALRSIPGRGTSANCATPIERIAIFCKTETVGRECLPEKICASEEMPRLGDAVELDKIEEIHIRRILASASPCSRRRKPSASTRPPSGAKEKNSAFDPRSAVGPLMQIATPGPGLHISIRKILSRKPIKSR